MEHYINVVIKGASLWLPDTVSAREEARFLASMVTLERDEVSVAFYAAAETEDLEHQLTGLLEAATCGLARNHAIGEVEKIEFALRGAR